MANFLDTHKRAIERAFYSTSRAGDHFRVIMWEPLPAPRVLPDACPFVENETATIVTFRRLPEGQYEPAAVDDRKAIADWNLRHRDTPASAWELPKIK